jgi:hypothetical protein
VNLDEVREGLAQNPPLCYADLVINHQNVELVGLVLVVRAGVGPVMPGLVPPAPLVRLGSRLGPEAVSCAYHTVTASTSISSWDSSIHPILRPWSIVVIIHNNSSQKWPLRADQFCYFVL